MDTKIVKYHNKLLTTEIKSIIKTLSVERDGKLCHRCHKENAKEIHHLKYTEYPVLNDLVMLCHNCHIDITVENRGHKRRKGLNSAEIRRLQRLGF